MGQWFAFWSASQSAQPFIPTIAQCMKKYHTARLPLTHVKGLYSLKPVDYKILPADFRSPEKIEFRAVSYYHRPCPSSPIFAEISLNIEKGQKARGGRQ